MPSPPEILAGLTVIANRAIGAALAWPIVVATALVALAMGWRPSERVITLSVLGLFYGLFGYGLFGVLRLGVLLDVGLVVGAIVLFTAAIRAQAPEARSWMCPSPFGKSR